tara:strand:+ start:2325 stop:2795 length:471 start_codon:yes stop_codon:yes gene_type:complete
MIKNIFIIIFLAYGVFGTGLLDILDKVPKPEPKPNPTAKILNIDKPNEDAIARVKLFSDLVTDPSDRAKLAIFNYQFAIRVLSYDATSQQTNDIYTLAGKTFFKDTLVNKYDGLAEEIVKLIKECIGEENHTLTQKEKELLNEYFLATAWILIQKG